MISRERAMRGDQLQGVGVRNCGVDPSVYATMLSLPNRRCALYVRRPGAVIVMVKHDVVLTVALRSNNPSAPVTAVVESSDVETVAPATGSGRSPGRAGVPIHVA